MPTYRGFDDTALHYDDHPTDAESTPPVIVLAGGAACHPDYLGDLAGLGLRHHFVMPHLRGVGDSPAPADPTTGSFWRQADDVDRLRGRLGLERAVLIGHSAGTRLAISYAAQYPDRVAGLLLITPPPGYLIDGPSDAEELVDQRRGEPIFDAALAAADAGPDTSNDDTFTQWQRSIVPMAYATWGPKEQTHAANGRWYLAAAQAYFSVTPPDDLAERLAAVTAPVLVIGGAQDCMTGVAPVIALSKLFPAGDITMIDNCGHFPWVETPAEFHTAASAYLIAQGV